MLKGLVARISLVFAMVAAAACVATLINALALADLAGRVRAVLAQDVIQAVALTRSQNHLLRMNSNLTGAVLKNNQDFAKANALVSKSLQDYRDRLAEVRGSSPEGAREADALAIGFREVEDSLATDLDLMRSGDVAGSRSAAANGVTPAVERQVARARTLIDAKWTRLEEDRDTTLKLATRRWFEIIILGGFSPVPAVMALIWLSRSGLRGPMRQITRAAERLRAGDLDNPVAGRDRADEVGSIAVSLDMMRQEALRARSLEAEAHELEAVAEAARLRDLTDAAFEGLAIVAGEFVVEANTSLAHMFGAERDTLIGASLSNLLRLDGSTSLATVLAAASHSPTRVTLARDGKPFPVEIRTRGLSVGADGLARQVMAIRDLRTQEAAEARIRHLAEHDVLTGLANRALLSTRFREAMDLAERTGTGFAVHCIDLDHFKPINDLHGHAAGDRVLCEVARRLLCETGANDTVARLGGDEFVVLQSGVGRTDSAIAFAGRLLEAIRHGFDIRGQEPMTLSASIGVSLYPGDGAVPDALLANADSAMYRIKKSSRDGVAFFQADRDAVQLQSYLLEQDLRRALPCGELSLVYQPQVLCGTGRVAGFEALLRWNHPVRGQVSPADFIPVAEDSDLIIEIGGWVMRQACMDAVKWDPALRVAVNVSPRQLEHDGFPEFVAATLAETGLDPSRLELEVTEGLLVREAERALKVIQALKGLGVKMALDDFGTGFSSLGMLSNFPFDRLKIDRSFVQQLAVRQEARAVISAVVALGHALNISVLAEGVETAAQLEILSEEGCDEVQGYLVGRPAKLDAYRNLTVPVTARQSLPECVAA